MDDDDKIRRNLTVFSASVLAAEYLGLPLGEIFQSTLHLAHPVSALKLSIAGLAILAYLGLRYKDVDLMRNLAYEEAVASGLKEITPVVVRNYAQFMTNLYIRTGYEAPIFVPSLKQLTLFKAANHHTASIFLHDIDLEPRLDGRGLPIPAKQKVSETWDFQITINSKSVAFPQISRQIMMSRN